MKKCISIFEPSIEILSESNKQLIKNFSVGEKAFDDFIKDEAIDEMENGNGVTYLVINKIKKKRELVAYYTISSSTIHAIDRFDFDDDDIPDQEKREHFSPISAFMIKMFAVNENYQDTFYDGELISSLILKSIISDLYDMSIGIIGAKRIILCSVDEAVKFYKRNKFQAVDITYTLFDKVDANDNLPMYLALHDV